MSKVLTHEADASRYTLVIDGQIAALADYRINGHSISFTHTYTQPEEYIRYAEEFMSVKE